MIHLLAANGAANTSFYGVGVGTDAVTSCHFGPAIAEFQAPESLHHTSTSVLVDETSCRLSSHSQGTIDDRVADGLPDINMANVHRRQTTLATESTTQGSATPTDPPRLTVNVGPLTTTFSPGTGCNNLTLALFGHRALSSTVQSIFEWLYGYQCSYTELVAVSSCLPSLYGPAYIGLGDQGNNGIYPVFSPGSICPSGYGSSCFMAPGAPTSMTTTYSGQTAPLSRWDNIKSSEIAIGCCPR